MTIFPITLAGNTLGERHKYLNALVCDVLKSNVNIKKLQSIQERSPVDRLFKIELASKIRDVDYIMKMLKDDDMLYVSRALKCTWLLESEYQNIINAEYLEQNLYPHMITTAVSKIKRWISVNLKDTERCQQFYEYYSNSNFDLAVRFLTHCQVSKILNEMPKILENLSPFYFKVFCEKSPQVARIFFDSLSTNEKVVNLYLESDVEYYNNLKVILKSDSEIFLDITEKYFDEYKFERLSSSATKFIMRNYKDRFTKKTELYTAWLLDIKTIAECLTTEECKDVVFKLARAQYLDSWFSYKEVEPFIKRLKEKERAVFKEKVFVKKDVGDLIREWPYAKPSPPSRIMKIFSLFDDKVRSVYFDEVEDDFNLEYCSLQLKCGDIDTEMRCRMNKSCTLLDQLFDEYRFASFEKTLIDLRKKIAVESSSRTRQYMMLVLVSKTGGRADSIDALLQILAKHVNEPIHVRSTIVRSFVKRAFVWRLPQESWKLFLEFAAGLGLDGKPSEAECREGLHAIALRGLLENGCVTPEILSAYIKEFSTLKEYSLTVSEQNLIAKILPELLLRSIMNEANTIKQAEMFDFLFQTLHDFKKPIDTHLIVPVLRALVNRDPKVSESLILNLFQDKKARRDLFLENFIFVSTDESYVNALRHNIEVLKMDKYVKRALEMNSHKEQFMRKLTIYFAEVNGLAELYSTAVKQSVSNKPNLKLARPLVMLVDFEYLDAYLKEIKEDCDKSVKRFAVALTANVHLARPKVDIDAIGWQKLGAKAIANRVLVCRKVDIKHHLVNLLKSPHTAKLAIVLSQGTEFELDTYEAVSKVQPNVALKCAVKHFHRDPNSFNLAVWEIVKPILRKFDFELKSNIHFSKLLWKIKKTPINIRAEYCLVLLAIVPKNATTKIVYILSHVEKLLEKSNSESIEDILSHFAENLLTVDKVLSYNDEKSREICAYLRILVKFILISKSHETQSKRFERFLEPVLNTLKAGWNIYQNKKPVSTYLNEIFETLRFKQVFFTEDYVSCMPVFERIVSWMHTFLPIEIYFEVYAKIHLNMLYFKTIRQCIKHKPDIFKDEPKTNKEGIDIVGRALGHYVVKEVDALILGYFDSIVELYARILYHYLIDLVNWDQMRDEFFAAVIKGITERAENTTQLLGIYLFKKRIDNGMNIETSKNIENIFKNMDHKEIQYFLLQITE